MPAAQYAELEVQPALRGVVAALWTVRFDADVEDWLVLPDGCLDIVLSAGSAPMVAGPATRSTSLRCRAGDTPVGLRFVPGTAPAVLGVGADELRDREVALADLPGPLDTGWAEEALEAGDVRRALDHLAALVASVVGVQAPDHRMAGVSRRPLDPLVRRAAAALRADPGRGVQDLANELALSPRQLRRRFSAHVGIGPRRYGRIMRLQRLTALADTARPRGATLGRLAADAGFADASQLVRDCRELAGRTPSALLAARESFDVAS